jgi:hypothetical protein
MLEKIKNVVLDFENSDEATNHLGGWYMHMFQTNGQRPVVNMDDIGIVWSAKVLQNWKVCLRSKVTDPNLFYECTYNGDTDELYVDVYLKFGSDVQSTPGVIFDHDTTSVNSSTLYGDSIKKVIHKYVTQHIDKTDNVQFGINDVYIVWTSMDFAEKNIHAMLSTTLPDGMYYEARYNTDKKDIRFRAYKKLKNYTVPNFTKEDNEQ